MNNPFIQKSNSGLWIAAAIGGAISAGAVAWFYLKRRMAVPQHNEHATDYLKPRPAKHRKTTDLHELHTIPS